VPAAGAPSFLTSLANLFKPSTPATSLPYGPSPRVAYQAPGFSMSSLTPYLPLVIGGVVILALAGGKRRR